MMDPQPGQIGQAGRWAAIVGRGREGRRAVTQRVISALRGRGLRVGGVVHERIDGDSDASDASDDKHIGYDAVNVFTGARAPLVRKSPTPEMCDYSFGQGVFEECLRWCTEAAAAADVDIIMLEAGRLEANRKGHWPAIEAMVAHPGVCVVLSVRPHVLAPVALSLPDPVAGLEQPISDTDITAFVDQIVSTLSGWV